MVQAIKIYIDDYEIKTSVLQSVCEWLLIIISLREYKKNSFESGLGKKCKINLACVLAMV